ncbi:hypothetical protein FHS83_000943 [Rhizomicrobium palustre]|uniref:DUF2793 domain-containing protein n=1 Tax=Rhizomicrobium palustre TaxID=189966 RepID=A0A846MWM6_9PROT|nr:DUF2793 domain-containing protein [Rhizomicrobium palustre]NIK87625.1 hypothetical protein [Rhizomicrobium palustre]
MSDKTPRLKLAQLVSLQSANPVTWNEALAELDALFDLCLLGQFVNTPPASPTDGDAYLTGGAPSGAWLGYAYKIAYCLDGAWRFFTPFNGLRAFVVPSSAFIVYLNGVWTDWNALISANETSIASAGTCDLEAAGSLFIQITGTSTITSFGSAANKLRFVRFAQGLTLTHNAASLVLLGGTSRVTQAGDVGLYASDASGNWRERAYFRAAANAGDFATKSGAETLFNKTLATPFVSGLLSLAGGQIGFPAAQIASPDANTLDDYEEGIWSPSIISAVPASGASVMVGSGSYIKIGRLVCVRFGIRVGSSGVGGSGAVRIGGLPFVQECTGSYAEAAVLLGSQGGFATPSICGAVGFFVSSNSAYMEGRILNTNGDTALNWSEITPNTFLGRELFYFTPN